MRFSLSLSLALSLSLTITLPLSINAVTPSLYSQQLLLPATSPPICFPSSSLLSSPFFSSLNSFLPFLLLPSFHGFFLSQPFSPPPLKHRQPNCQSNPPERILLKWRNSLFSNNPKTPKSDLTCCSFGFSSICKRVVLLFIKACYPIRER